LVFSYSDKNGGVELYKRGQIIIVKLSGACGTRVINYYSEKLQDLAASYKGLPWAYLCDGKSFHATTPEAQKTIVKTYRASMQLGCRYEAYCYDSAVGKAQTQQIMSDCGNHTPIEKVLFDSEYQAEVYLLGKLSLLQKSSLSPNNTESKKSS
jgi:hypothetical protein